MKIKSAKSFRQWYKNLIPGRKNAPQYYDENFMGVQHKDLSGFLSMYHGDKEDIYGFLRKEVEMAEDGQAIYEFVQNAADSNSTQFYMLYDKSHLIVINNGNEFSKDGVKSILNIGQSFGKEDSDKIGRYGIGFKLVHRLVGKSSGLDELFNTDEKGFRGPILFSWSEKSQLDNFLKTDENEFEYVDFNENDSPWLLKILITNFPAQPKEKVKDIDFNEVEPFNTNELLSFQAFLNSCKDKIDLNSLNSGTIFFLKLGDEKFDYLERQQQEYLNGLSTSMHFLKSLDTLVVNDNKVNKDREANNVLEFIVKNGTDDFNNLELTEARDKESDAKFKICFADNATSANEIKKHPNIYKYFPAVKEVNNLSFVVHSNLFELSSNRQNLTDTPINRNLLSLLSKQIIGKMEESKFGNNRNLFKKLFTSILMSDQSSNSSSGSGWQNDFFYKNLLAYIQDSIPTKKDSYSNNVINVKINKLKLNLDLADFGLGHINWFEWDNEADRLLIDEATNTEKLGIEEWSVRDIIENANLENINNWIATCDKKNYQAFLAELEKCTYLRKETKEKICQIKFFKFSNDKFYSLNEIVKRQIIQNRVTFNYGYSNVFFKSPKTEIIANELGKLGIFLSEINVFEYPNIFSSVEKMPDEKLMYTFIAEKCKTNTLSAQEKRNVFLNFINETTKFDDVGDETFKKLELFCDSQNIVKPLSELASSSASIPKWLNSYKIKTEENIDFIQLNSYLIQANELFEKIVLPNIEIIKDELTEAKEIKELVTFFKENHRSFFNEFIIQKSTSRFTIIDKSDKYQIIPSKDERKTFINFIESKLSDNFIVLPYDFSDFNDQDGILKGEKLHFQILELVDVDEHKETLIDIVHYNEPKRKLLREISKFSFNSETEYTKEDYEYKILDLACNELKENDFQTFRNKVIIETGNRSFNLSEIPPIVDKIKIATKEFSLSKILPSTYENNNLISDLITLFTEQGIPIEKLKALFGVNEEIDIDDVFEKFSEQTPTLQNAVQFFFLIYYNNHISTVDLSKLGFDISAAVYPSEFALESEKLPEYLQEWIKKGEIIVSNLESVGIYTENSTLVSLRKFFLIKSDFNQNDIAKDSSLSDGKMLFNTFEVLKEKEIELKAENEFAVFKEMVRVINFNKTIGQELIIQEEYNFALLAEHSNEWKSIGEFSIYLFNGKLPKFVKLDEIPDYVFYRYKDTDYAVNGNILYINENEDKTKILQKVALDEKNDFTSEDSKDIELSEVKAELEKYKKEGQPKEDNPNSSFLEDINDFISELEGTEWSSFVPELKNIVELSVSQPKEKQKLFNLIAKIKLAKELNIHFESANKDYNHLENGNEKYFVHSARGAFAYIHPNEILRMKEEGYKMALDFSTKSRIKIYDTAEEILQLNTNHILAYQYDKTMDELFTFCEANRDANKHLLIIDKNNSGEKSRVLLKLLNIEDDYQ